MKENFLVAHNIQSAVDYDTKLICGINITQSPTDHYKLPEIENKEIKNIGKTSKYIIVYTIYLNQISQSYFVDNNIGGLIPTRKQSKEKTKKLNPNPLEEIDASYCPRRQFMYFFREYAQPNKDQNKPAKITRIYKKKITTKKT